MSGILLSLLCALLTVAYARVSITHLYVGFLPNVLSCCLQAKTQAMLGACLACLVCGS